MQSLSNKLVAEAAFIGMIVFPRAEQGDEAMPWHFEKKQTSAAKAVLILAPSTARLKPCP